MYRLSLSLFLLASLALPRLATAQFVPPEEATTQPQDTYTPPPAPPRREAEQPPAVRARADEGPTRPTGFSLGVGAGWTFPASIIDPNTASARFRFDNLTIEGLVALGVGTGTELINQPGDDVQNDASSYDVGLGAELRYGFMKRGQADFLIIGSAQFGTQGLETDPEGPDNLTRVLQTTAGLGWGLGVEWFLHRHLSLSADAINPVVLFSSTSEQVPAAEVTTTNTQLLAGLFLRPTVRAMFHVYF